MIDKPLSTDSSLAVLAPVEGTPLDVDISETSSDPEMTILPDGGVEISAMDAVDYFMVQHDDNLAEYLDDDDLGKVSTAVLEGFRIDEKAREEWHRDYKELIKLLGLVREKKTEPFRGACNSVSPVVLEALIRFQSSTMNQVFPAEGPVDTKVIGKLTPDKVDAAARVKDHLNNYLTRVLPNYVEETEMLCFDLGACGAAFTKIVPDKNWMPERLYIPAEDMYIPYGTTSLEKAPRKTCLLYMSEAEMAEKQANGEFLDLELGPPLQNIVQSEVKDAKDNLSRQSEPIESAFYTLLEQHVYMRIPKFDNEKDIPRPYIVTVEKMSEKVLSIRRNWEESDVFCNALQWFVMYSYVPGPRAPGYGLLHIGGGLAETETNATRALVNAGMLSNHPGGLMDKGLRVDINGPFQPGEWKQADAHGARLADSLFPLPYKEPSPTLFNLAQKAGDENRRLMSIADTPISAGGGDTPVGTTVALIERDRVVMSAVQKRFLRSMGKELLIMKRCIRKALECDCELDAEGFKTYDIEGGERKIAAQDYSDKVNIIPVADPNSGTFALRIMQYQAFAMLMQQIPENGVDKAAFSRQFAKVLGIREADLLIPDKAHIPVMEPVAENMAMMQNQPVKVFPFQNHKAHIGVHQAFLQDPGLKAFLGQIPSGQQIIAAIDAHLLAHMAEDYRQEMEKKAGFPFPPPDQPIAPEAEYTLSYALAPAAQKLLEANQSEAQQKQRQQQLQDPVIQQQQVENQLKAKDIDAKTQVAMAKVQSAERIAAGKAQADQARMQMQAAEQNMDLRLKMEELQAAAAKDNADIALIRAQIAKIMAEIHRPQEPV